jgi:hypothetical protein
LQALVLARRDLVKDRLAYANCRAAPEALVESFDAQIKAIEADINALYAGRDPIAVIDTVAAGTSEAKSTAARPRRVQEFWSGRRESNPRMKLGKLPFYH